MLFLFVFFVTDFPKFRDYRWSDGSQFWQTKESWQPDLFLQTDPQHKCVVMDRRDGALAGARTFANAECNPQEFKDKHQYACERIKQGG